MFHAHHQKSSWGDAVVKKLSQDLQKTFPGMRGFSTRSLWRMRDFFLSYKDDPKLSGLSECLNWTHNVIILEKCSDPLEREYYLRMSIRNGWSKRSLENFIRGKTYQSMLTNQTNFEDHLPKELAYEAKTVVRDEYTFDFLELTSDHTEKELETAILAKIQLFLREMGGVLSFVGSQYHLEIGGEDFFVDLVLYHRRLKALVAIELKRGKFIPEYVGKMQFYLAALDKKSRFDYDNPSIGIILCKEKNKTIVEFALKESKKPIGIAGYSVTRKLPKNLEHELPSADQIVKLLDSL